MSALNSKTLLRAESLQVKVGARQLLSGASVCLSKGQWVCVCGPNGAGKSTLMRALAGLQASTGEVQLMGRPLSQWPAAQRAARLSWMGQAQPVPFDLSVHDVVQLGRWPHRHIGQLGDASHDRAVKDALMAMGLQNLAQRGLQEVSGGECQRALLARAMASQTPVMLFDEPLNHLDMPHQHAWLAWLKAHVATGAGVLTVMHDLNLALAADQVLVMHQGRVLHQGPPGQSQTREALQVAFDQALAFHLIDTNGTAPRWVVLPRPIS